MDIINSAFDIFEQKTNIAEITEIWNPILEKADL
jgi:hypothetical protein